MLRSPVSDVEIPDVPLTDFVLARAGQLGQKPALIDAPTGRTITYAELAESVRGGAAGLAERGFGKGEVFAHFAPNVPEYAVAFHAVATVGGVNTTANPLLTAEELAAQLRDCGARLLVTVPEQLEKATAAAEQAGVEEIFVYGGGGRDAVRLAPAGVTSPAVSHTHGDAPAATIEGGIIVLLKPAPDCPGGPMSLSAVGAERNGSAPRRPTPRCGVAVCCFTAAGTAWGIRPRR